MLPVAAQLLDVSAAEPQRLTQVTTRTELNFFALTQSLEYMHVRAGLVHGDLSLSNIMLLDIAAGMRELRLFDLGCSRSFAPGTRLHMPFLPGHCVSDADMNGAVCFVAKQTHTLSCKPHAD